MEVHKTIQGVNKYLKFVLISFEFKFALKGPIKREGSTCIIAILFQKYMKKKSLGFKAEMLGVGYLFNVAGCAGGGSNVQILNGAKGVSKLTFFCLISWKSTYQRGLIVLRKTSTNKSKIKRVTAAMENPSL